MDDRRGGEGRCDKSEKKRLASPVKNDQRTVLSSRGEGSLELRNLYGTIGSKRR